MNTNPTTNNALDRLSTAWLSFAMTVAAVFGIALRGALTTWVAFSGTDGYRPDGAVTLGSDGNLYGVTEFGGTNAVGTIFQFSPANGLKTLVSFTRPAAVH